MTCSTCGAPITPDQTQCRYCAASLIPVTRLSIGAIQTPPMEARRFSVVLTSPGKAKIGMIKVVREVTGLSLKEAKNLVDDAPKPIKQAISREEADSIARKLRAVGFGATAEVAESVWPAATFTADPPTPLDPAVASADPPDLSTRRTHPLTVVLSSIVGLVGLIVVGALDLSWKLIRLVPKTFKYIPRTLAMLGYGFAGLGMLATVFDLRGNYGSFIFYAVIFSAVLIATNDWRLRSRLIARILRRPEPHNVKPRTNDAEGPAPTKAIPATYVPRQIDPALRRLVVAYAAQRKQLVSERRQALAQTAEPALRKALPDVVAAEGPLAALDLLAEEDDNSASPRAS